MSGKAVEGLVLVGLLMCAVTSVCPGEWPFEPPGPGKAFAEDHIIVRFKASALEHRFGKSRDVNVSGAARSLGLPMGADVVDTAFGRWRRRKEGRGRGAGPDTAIDLDRHVYLRVPPGMTVTGLVEILKRNPNVDYAEPDRIGSGGAMPNDPDFPGQWWHLNNRWTNGTNPADIRSTQAWEITQGSTSIVVAVLDTGLTAAEPEFLGRRVPGYDIANNDADPTDDHGHGSFVSSIIAANANNTTQLAGVNWNCGVMPVKVLNASPILPWSNATSACTYGRLSRNDSAPRESFRLRVAG